MKRRGSKREERRKDKLELNLLAADEGPRIPGGKHRRGCTLPFAGSLLTLLGIAALRAVLG